MTEVTGVIIASRAMIAAVTNTTIMATGTVVTTIEITVIGRTDVNVDRTTDGNVDQMTDETADPDLIEDPDLTDLTGLSDGIETGTTDGDHLMTTDVGEKMISDERLKDEADGEIRTGIGVASADVHQMKNGEEPRLGGDMRRIDAGHNYVNKQKQILQRLSHKGKSEGLM